MKYQILRTGQFKKDYKTAKNAAITLNFCRKPPPSW